MVKPRRTQPTVKFIDDYCEAYRDLFPEVRTFEYFKYLHLGMISDIKRKTLPVIAKVVGLEDAEGLDHFLTESPWSVEKLKERRLKIILNLLNGEEIIVIFDETGDKKKGRKPDYVKRQYIGNLGKIENGIVAVTAWGLFRGMTFPLIAKVYKPQERLKEGDEYKSKPKIGGEIIQKLKEMGFKIKLLLADSESSESEENFVSILNEEKLDFVLAIRSNHGVWLPSGQRVRCNKWRDFERVFSTGKTEERYIREIIFGKKKEIRYWEVTDNKETLPKNSTWYIMTKIPKINYKEVGNLYGLRNWVEYGLKQSKNELGWADFRVTDYSRIEKWWEIVMSAYLMVSLQSEELKESREASLDLAKPAQEEIKKHPSWDKGKGWKNILNNLRLFIQPLCYFNLLKP
ncbi:DDE transposase [Microcystis aeruginosa]|nr:DDE transposase [Microcystis aeruginosa]